MLKVGQPTQYSPDGVNIEAATVLEVGGGTVNVLVWESIIPAIATPRVRLNVPVSLSFPAAGTVNGGPLV